MAFIIETEIRNFQYWYGITGRMEGLKDNATSFTTIQSAERRIAYLGQTYPLLSFYIRNTETNKTTKKLNDDELEILETQDDEGDNPSESAG